MMTSGAWHLRLQQADRLAGLDDQRLVLVHGLQRPTMASCAAQLRAALPSAA
jgi:hypothetical protein